MTITECRVKLANPSAGRTTRSSWLLAYASIVLDGAFVVHEIRLVDAGDRLIVGMPSRKMADRCPACGCKNNVRARYCGECGGALEPARSERDEDGRYREHVDLCHPITNDARLMIESAVIAAYRATIEHAKDGNGHAAGRPGDAGELPVIPTMYG